MILFFIWTAIIMFVIAILLDIKRKKNIRNEDAQTSSTSELTLNESGETERFSTSTEDERKNVSVKDSQCSCLKSDVTLNEDGGTEIFSPSREEGSNNVNIKDTKNSCWRSKLKLNEDRRSEGRFSASKKGGKNESVRESSCRKSNRPLNEDARTEMVSTANGKRGPNVGVKDSSCWKSNLMLYESRRTEMDSAAKGEGGKHESVMESSCRKLNQPLNEDARTEMDSAAKDKGGKYANVKESSCGKWNLTLNEDGRTETPLSSVSKGGENLTVCVNDSKDSCRTSELPSKQLSEKTKIKITASENEAENMNICIDDSKDSCRTSEIPSKQLDEENEKHFPVPEKEENLNVCINDSKDTCPTSKLTSKQLEGENEMNIYKSEDEEKSNVFIKDSKDLEKIKKRPGPRKKKNASEKPLTQDQETECNLSSLEDEGNLNDLNKKLESGCRTSEVMSNLQEEVTESKVSTSEDEENTNAKGVGPFMCKLFEQQLYTDVTFFSGGNKASLSAHRAVLAAKCEYFENLLFGDQKNETVGMEMQVQIKEVPFCCFGNMVKYFYTGGIEFTDDYTVLEIYAAAQTFQIQPLIDQCEIYIESMELTENNVCSTLQVCNAKSIEQLKTRCISYIEKNTFQVINSKDFENCSFNTVREISTLRCLNLSSEVELLKAVLRWVNVQPELTKKELTKSLLKCIRFLSFTPKEFTNIMQRHAELLTSEDGLKILMYLNNPTSDNFNGLPEWCSKSPRSVEEDHKVFQTKPLNVERRIRIPLRSASEQQEMSEITSVLEMKCIKGYHQINVIKFLFEGISNQTHMIAVLLMKVHVLPTEFKLCFKKMIDSKETVFQFFRGIKVCRGQTLKVEIKAALCRSCKFLQLDASENDFEYEHFQCYITSRPKYGRFFCISEIEYGPQLPR